MLESVNMHLVFDIGGTNSRLAVSEDGKTLLRSKLTPTQKDFNSHKNAFKKAAEELLEGEKVTSASGGIAVVLDNEKNIAVKTSNLQNWVGIPLKKEFEEVLGTEVNLENDTVVGGLGEAIFGAGKESKIIAFITIGTGLGGVRIVNGKVDAKVIGFEPGHQIIHPEGNLCGCGGKGHWEAYVAGASLEKIYNQKGEDIKDPNIWDEVAKNFSIGLTNTIVHWSPDLVILGGAVSQSLPIIKVENYLKEYLTIFPVAPQIKKATLGVDAGLYGALTLTT